MILALVLSLLGAQPQFVPPLQPLETIARQLFTNFVSARYAAVAKDFNEEMRATVTPKELAQQRDLIASQIGPFEYIMTVKRRTEGGWPVVDVTAKYERSLAVMTVSFDETFHVSKVTIAPLTGPPPDPLEREARSFLADFNARNFEAVENRFDARMRQSLPTPQLEELSRTVTRTYGAFTSITEARTGKRANLTTVELLADYSGTPVQVSVVFNRAHRIAGLTFAPARK